MAYLSEQLQQLRELPGAIKGFYVGDIFYGFATAIFNTLFNLHLLEVGYTAEHIGRLQSVAALITAVIAIPIGLIGDRFGSRRMYVSGSVLFAAPYLIMPWLHSFNLLVAVYALGTVGSTLMLVNESPLLANEVSAEKRATVFSFMLINFFLWTTLGVQLSGFLTQWLPRGSLSQYQWPLVIAGICGIIAGLIRMSLPFRPLDAAARPKLNLKPSPVTFKLAVVSMLSATFTALLFSFTNVILAQRFHFGPESIATTMTVLGVIGWIGSMLVPWVSRRFGDMAGYMMVVTVHGSALLLMAFLGEPSLFLSALWVRSLVNTMQQALFLAVSMGAVPATERATASSLSVVGRNLGTAFAAKGFGTLLAAGNFFLPFLLAGAGAFATVIGTLMLFGRPGRSELPKQGA